MENFTRSELIPTQKKSKKKGKNKAKSKKNDKSVEENKQKQIDESIAVGLKVDTSVLDTVRAKLNDLFTDALNNHKVVATTVKEKIDAFIAEQQEEHVACALENVVTELYEDAQYMVAGLYVEVDEKIEYWRKRLHRNDTRKFLKYNIIDESGNDASKLYTKQLLILKPIFGSEISSSPVIKHGEYKWMFKVYLKETSLQFVLLPDTSNNPKSNFYALITLAIIHPLDPKRTECFDAFSFVCKACTGNVFVLPSACEEGFLDDEGNVEVELQIQMIGENVFPPLLVRKFRLELVLAYTADLDFICSKFFEKTRANLKSMVEDKNKWSRFCTFMKESGQISKNKMCSEKQDVIKERLVKRFFADGNMLSPLLMGILHDGYQSINNTTAKFVRIKENRFELVGDVPSLFMSVVDTEYEQLRPNTPTVEEYESRLIELGRMIVESYVIDYLFRNKIDVSFTRSELKQTEKKSKKKGNEEHNDVCSWGKFEFVDGLEEDTSVPKIMRAKLMCSFMDDLNNHMVAIDKVDATSVPSIVRAELIYLFMNALKDHEVIAITLKEKINALIEQEHIVCELQKTVTELYMVAQKRVAAFYEEEQTDEEIASLETLNLYSN